MDRVTRKANLKKLQLPATTRGQSRKTRQNLPTGAGVLSNYFLTPENVQTEISENKIEPKESAQKELDLQKLSTAVVSCLEANSQTIPPKRQRKRLKLDEFVHKNKSDNCKTDTTEPQEEESKGIRQINDDDLFDIPTKKIKKAPNTRDAATSSVSKKSVTKSPKTTKITRKKKQTTVKSAFLRNEQIFSEIAAQHCAAEQFDGDEIQLALAISRSESEQHCNGQDNNNSAEDVVELIDIDKDNSDSVREKLSKYGFRTAEKKDYNALTALFMPTVRGRRKKEKWANKFTALTLRNSENQLKKVEEKICTILKHHQYSKQIINSDEPQQSYSLSSCYLGKYLRSSADTIKLVEFMENQANIEIEKYFVTDLVPISKLPSGHLLKDWSVIQGRDFTPNEKDKIKIRRLKQFEKAYTNLEEYFACSKRKLEYAEINDADNDAGDSDEILRNEKVCKTNEINLENASENLVENNEKPNQEQQIDVIEEPPSVDRLAIDRIATIENEKQQGNNILSKKIKELIPVTKSLDLMQVSSTSIETQATINESTQKTRSNSPDLFADDSDAEDMNSSPNYSFVDKKVEAKNLNSCSLSKSIEQEKHEELILDSMNNGKINQMKDNGVISYEIYSSDEVKNTSSAINNISKEPQDVIDLTADETEVQDQKHKEIQNSSTLIEEVEDLFADSPIENTAAENYAIPKDINSNSQQSRYLKDADNTFKLSLSPLTLPIITNEEAPNEFENFEFDKNETTLLLRDMSSSQVTTDSSFLNFQGPKQFTTSFHRKTTNAAVIPNEIEKPCESSLSFEVNYKDDLPGSSSMFTMEETTITGINKTDNNVKQQAAGNNTSSFRELYQKYLGKPPAHHDRKSLTQIETSKNANQQFENEYSFSMDLELSEWNLESISRKSNSLANFNSIDKKTKYSFTQNLADISIDLTQNDDGDSNDAVASQYSFNDNTKQVNCDNSNDNAAAAEDDDCLILSDDEINYSIWQADKTSKYSECKKTNSKKNNIKEKDADNLLEYSFMDILNDEAGTPSKSLANSLNQKPQSCRKHLEYSAFSLKEDCCADIEQLQTPAKSQNLDEFLEDLSFLGSPSEKTDAMKYFRSCRKSTQKFQDLLSQISPPISTANHSSTASITKNLNNHLDEAQSNCLVWKTCINSNKNLNNILAEPKPDGIEWKSPRKLKVPKTPQKTPQKSNQLLSSQIILKATQKSPTKSFFSGQCPIEPQEILINNKCFVIKQSKSRVKPDYTKQSEAELLKQLYEFGIKPLKRKQAVKMLEYIYNQTHPTIVDDIEEEEGDIDEYVPKSDNFTMDIELPQASNAAFISQSKDTANANNIRKETVTVLDNASKAFQLSNECTGKQMLRYSCKFKPELSDENYILQTNVTKKTLQPLLPFHIAWYNLVCSNPKLHEAILMYEPIDLQDIYLFLKGIGYRYDPKDLKLFFDQRCIIFRYDLSNTANGKDNNRHVRKSKKKFNKKS